MFISKYDDWYGTLVIGVNNTFSYCVDTVGVIVANFVSNIQNKPSDTIKSIVNQVYDLVKEEVGSLADKGLLLSLIHI